MPKKPERRKTETNESWGKTDFKYTNSPWIKLRNAHRLREPLCRECRKNGELTPMNVVDHIKPISQGGDPWDEDNLQSLCSSCHNRKSAVENK